MITVRQPDISQAEILYSLVRQFPTPTPASKHAFVRCLEWKLADPHSYIALAWEGQSALGYISGDCHAAFYAGGPVAWVDEILVIPERRRCGVGMLLMQAFERWATEHRSVLVSLATVGSVAFYQRLGYATQAGYFKKYLERDESESDAL